jgi:hypothetical protein
MPDNLTPAWFEPGYQPNGATTPVRFQLRPLDMPTFWRLQRSLRPDGLPEWEGVAAAFEYCVIGWEGLPAPFSRQAKREALEKFDRSMSVWLGQIAAHCYTGAILTEDERKNS